MPSWSSLRQSGRAWTAAVMALLAVALVAPGAGAWTIVSTNGPHGTWAFDDTDAAPGAYCGIGTTGLYIFPNDSLKIWARDLTSGPDRRYVALTLIAEQRKNGRWVRRTKGGLTSEQATDTVPATFALGWQEFAPVGRYRLKLKLIWYTSTWGVVAGTVTIRIQHYLYESETAQTGSCTG